MLCMSKFKKAGYVIIILPSTFIAFVVLNLIVINMEPSPNTLADFDYAFNAEGQLRKIYAESGLPGEQPFRFAVSQSHRFNQRNYEEIGEVITEHVYNMLENEYNLLRKPLPVDEDIDKQSFVFMSEDALTNPDKLLILIHGSGVVRAGQWARSLIINDCLKTGTQFEYIQKAVKKGFGILITNTNDNHRMINGVKVPIPGSSDPETHMASVWKHFVEKSKAKNLFIVAHSYGGVVTVQLASTHFDSFSERVKAVAFTDSVHSLRSDVPPSVVSYLREIGNNWVSSLDPLDTPLKTPLYEVQRMSAGHKIHEMTSSCCINSVFDFFNDKLNKMTDENDEL